MIRYPSKTKCNDRLSRSLQTEIKSATQRTIPNPSKQWIQYPGLYKLCLGTSDPSLHIIKGQVLHPPFLNITLGLGKAPFTNLPDVRLLLNDLGELWSVFLVGPGASALSRTLPLRWHGIWTDQISLSQAEGLNQQKNPSDKNGHEQRNIFIWLHSNESADTSVETNTETTSRYYLTIASPKINQKHRSLFLYII